MASSSMKSSTFQSPKRPSQWVRRKELMSKFSYGGGVDFASRVSFSLSVYSTCNLIGSSLAFEHCEGYYNSNLLSKSLAFFGDKDLSFFGSNSKTISSPRRQRRKDHSGNCSIVCFSLIFAGF